MSKDEIITPKLTRCGVEGVMRANLISEFRKNGLKIKIRDCSMEDLANAEEVFVTNALIGLWPVVKLNDLSWSVGKIAQTFQPEKYTL